MGKGSFPYLEIIQGQRSTNPSAEEEHIKIDAKIEIAFADYENMEQTWNKVRKILFYNIFITFWII